MLTTCKGALHPHFSAPVIRLCQTFPFSVLFDESNKGDMKHFDILVCIWGQHYRLASNSTSGYASYCLLLLVSSLSVLTHFFR